MPHFIPKSNTISNSPVFFLQLTWPPFGRLSDTQVSTHPQFLPENQALPNETTPVQNRRVVWEELALEWLRALHNYLYVKICKDNSRHFLQLSRVESIHNILYLLRMSLAKMFRGCWIWTTWHNDPGTLVHIWTWRPISIDILHKYFLHSDMILQVAIIIAILMFLIFRPNCIP